MTPKKDHVSALHRAERSRVRAAKIYQLLQGREKRGVGKFLTSLVEEGSATPPGRVGKFGQPQNANRQNKDSVAGRERSRWEAQLELEGLGGATEP